MGNSNMDVEKEISLVDLFWQFLKGWRLIIAFAIIFAILAGVYKYHANATSIKNTEDSQSVSIEDIQSDLTEEETKSVEEASKIKNQLDAKQNYADNSILMQMDPYAKNVVTIQYYVDTEYTINIAQDITSDYASELVDTYNAFVENGGLESATQEELQWNYEPEYINELITLGGRIDNSGDNTNDVSEAGNTITIYATALSEAECGELEAAIEQAMNDYQNVLSDKIGTHKLVLVDSYSNVVTDDALITKQAELDTTIETLQTNLDTLEATMSTNALKVLNKDEVQEDGVAEQTVSKATAISKKYILLGFVLGIFLACVWISLKYILSNSIKSSEELQSVYGLRVLGTYKKSGKDKKKIFAFVDQWLEGKQHRNALTEEEEQELIITNLSVTCKKENIQKLFLTTSLHMSGQDKERIEDIASELEKAGIQVALGEDIVRNAKSLIQIAEIGKVVLVEKAEMTQYKMLEKEMTLCSEQKADVIGCIMIEA